MTMRLYPQFHPIDRKEGETDMQILLKLVATEPSQLESQSLPFDEETFEYSKIGDPVDEASIKALCEAMLKVAKKHGYPEPPNRTKARAADKEWGEVLHRMMGITRNEASKAGIWNALSCHYLPYLVAWRWQASENANGKVSERWLVQDRQERHAFGRLWWRHEIVKDTAKPEDPYWILGRLMEDEIVQIMERSSLSSHKEIVLALAKTHIEHQEGDGEERMLAFRRAIKLLRLRASVRELGVITARGLADDFTSKIYKEANGL